jgi:uncharacterized protein YabN with tetrapyrrole methylase and pyrophosphatase domain
MIRGRLTVVGTGIEAVAQITQETVAHIKRADKLLHLATDPVTTQWLHELNPSAEALNTSYAPGRPRIESYEEMVARILEPVRAGKRVCFTAYGHPGVCVYPSHEAIRRARAEGHHAVMLPGISCEDCLYADLGIDPGRDGCHAYEASHFLLYRRAIDVCSGLILWQIGPLGQTDWKLQFSTAGLPLLVEVLAEAYGPGHIVTLYEAATYAICEPLIVRLELSRVPEARVSWMTTMYVPPLRCAERDPVMASRLRALLEG